MIMVRFSLPKQRTTSLMNLCFGDCLQKSVVCSEICVLEKYTDCWMLCYSIVDKDNAHVQEKLAVSLILEIGHGLHIDAVKSGFASNVYVENTLVSIYGTCGSISEADEMFIEMEKRDVVSMLSVFLDLRECKKIFCLYKEMQECCITPDEWTLTIVLQACAIAGDEETISNDEIAERVLLNICHSLHHNAVWKGLSDDFLVGNTIVTTYCNLGCMNDAKTVFDGLQQLMMSVWNCLLAAYAEQNQATHALELYGCMKMKRAASDDLTFVCVFQACSVLGAMELCWQLHFSIVASGFCVNPRLATSLIHAYGSCGSTLDSQGVLDQFLQSDVVAYSACVAGYALEGNCNQSCYMICIQVTYVTIYEDAVLVILSVVDATLQMMLSFMDQKYDNWNLRNFAYHIRMC